MVDQTTPKKPLRLWPGVTIVTLQWLLRFVVPLVVPAAVYLGLMAGMAGGVLILLWWVFFSRAPWVERLGAVVLWAVALVATPWILDESIAGGMMGMMFYVYVIPILSLAFVLWAVATRHLDDGPRRATMAAAIFLACASLALVRTEGMTGEADSEFAWRWSPTAEERLLAQAGEDPIPPAPATDLDVMTPDSLEPDVEAPDAMETAAGEPEPVEAEPEGGSVGSAMAPEPERPDAGPPAMDATDSVASEPDATDRVATVWPGFRGPGRDGVVAGTRIATDWTTSPPVELWRRPVGPGWSSFAVRGDVFYTQEQRGEDEVVSCYRVATGEPVWLHRDPVRFYESNAGAGPRGTPTLSNGRVYTFGATGLVNALDAVTGAVVWSRDAAADTGAETPTWGFSSSPLVLGDAVIVAASGTLIAYHPTTGEPLWRGPEGGTSYSSPQIVTIDGAPQILLLDRAGATGVAPADGTVLWEHPWPGYPIVQPAQASGGDLLLAASEQSGMRRLAVARDGDGWTATERWTSIRLKPYFNDFVVHGAHAYGFDGSILACVDLADGERKWKGGRYGHGQLVLLPDQDLLLVLSEKGELALVRAVPGGFEELARHPAIEGKTWNHPALAGDVLLVRNAEEMAAFRLSS